jgi:hypothetical protein
MAIIKNVEVWWAKLDPAHPVKPVTPTNDDGTPKPKQWEVQIRTTSKEQKAELANIGVVLKAVREDKDDEESKILYYKTNLSRKAVKREPGKPDVPNEAPAVTNGRGEPVDPTTLGNGTVCNIRIYQREYELKGIKKTANTLMALQVVKHVVYTASPMEDFEEEFDTETILPEEESTPPTTHGDDEF